MSDDFENEAKRHLYNTLKRDSKSINFERNIVPYLSHLKSLRQFLLEPNELPERSSNAKLKPQKRVLNDKQIPTPCKEQVDIYLKKWHNLEKYVAQEKAINKLFDTYSNNTDLNDVLAKVSILNDFYSTHIFQTYLVAKHIVELDIDKRLINGDLTLVNDIASISLNNKRKYLYSFASKYCSHHNEETYAIYDSYVEKVLKYFRRVDCFAEFYDGDLKDYVKFNDVLISFRRFYRLEQYSLKQIDKYLWQLGKEYFPNKNYKQ